SAERFVTGGVGPIEVYAVLQVDEPGKYELRQGLLAMRWLVHDAEEDAIGLEDMAAMNQIQPAIQLVVDRALDALRLLVGPMDDRLDRRAVERLAASRVVARRLVDFLVPD